MSMHPTVPEYMDRLMGDAMNLMDQVEDLAEQELLSRCRDLSLKFPDRVITVVGGMGDLFVEISLKQTNNVITWSWYSFAGDIRYVLSHGGHVDGPDILRPARDWLFGWMEEAEGNAGNRYDNHPMVACGIVRFLNGERICKT